MPDHVSAPTPAPSVPSGDAPGAVRRTPSHSPATNHVPGPPPIPRLPHRSRKTSREKAPVRHRRATRRWPTGPPIHFRFRGKCGTLDPAVPVAPENRRVTPANQRREVIAMQDHTSDPTPASSTPSGDAPTTGPASPPSSTGDGRCPQPTADATDTSYYKSQGTVSFCTGSTGTYINFVPHGDYLVKHEGKSYAAFLTDDGRKSILKLCKDERGNPTGLRIKIGNQALKCLRVSEMLIWTGAWSAAITHSKIQVEVKKNGESLTLTGITIPAK